jgi:multidrug resistance protein
MTALYAAMQFIFAPVLGALSDNLGRRPVLLISLAGAAINYVVMAFAPKLWMLLLGRAIAGLTSANISVATAYITDISPEDTRARRFGLFNGIFGAGFIIGPVLGGVLGDYWLRLPFIAAAVLNACNLLLALFVLPESHTPARQKIGLAALNPLLPLRWVFSMKGLLPIVLVYFILSGTGGPTEPVGRCRVSTHSSGMACGSAFRWAHLVSARRWCKRSCRARRPSCSASAPEGLARSHLALGGRRFYNRDTAGFSQHSGRQPCLAGERVKNNYKSE